MLLYPAGLLDPRLPMKKVSYHGGRGSDVELQPELPASLSTLCSLDKTGSACPHYPDSQLRAQRPHREFWQIVDFSSSLSHPSFLSF